MNYVKLLEISSFFTCHIFLEVGKIQDMPSKIWQTLGDALRPCLVAKFKIPNLSHRKRILNAWSIKSR